MSDNYSREFNYKVINDPIYGCINLSETEVKLLDTRAMQRLRRVRQMGFASYVFPSGEHSRFVHSLGVLCIMGKMCERLYMQYIDDPADKKRFSIEDVRKMRISALLHDVGHFPFSHLSECVYSYIAKAKNTSEMIEGLGNDPFDDKNLLSDIANFKKSKEIDHEHMGAEVIKRDPEIITILEHAKIDPDEIGHIIVGDTPDHPVYAQLIHSSLDADRLDYLLRDSRQAGVSFGNIELEYILKQLRIESMEVSDRNGNIKEMDFVVFDSRAQHAIEHFLMARYFHYTQVVFHKTSSVFEAVAKALTYKVLVNADTPYKTFEAIVDTIGSDKFYGFTDDYLWQTISSYCSKTKDEYVKTLWECLNQRKKPKHVITLKDIMPKKAASESSIPVNDSSYLLSKWLIKNMREELAKVVDIDSKYIAYTESVIRIESIPSHLRIEDCSIKKFEDEMRDAIRIVDKQGKITFLASDSKSLINKMVDFTSNTLDIFVVGDITKGKAEMLKKEILRRAKENI